MLLFCFFARGQHCALHYADINSLPLLTDSLPLNPIDLTGREGGPPGQQHGHVVLHQGDAQPLAHVAHLACATQAPKIFLLPWQKHTG